jgi:hypothetical protein
MNLAHAIKSALNWVNFEGNDEFSGCENIKMFKSWLQTNHSILKDRWDDDMAKLRKVGKTFSD